MTDTLNILRIDSSARREGSVSRELADLYIDALSSKRSVRVQTRDVNDTLPMVTDDWIAANFTPSDQRTSDHKAVLATSDRLIDEIENSDVLVFSVPIYNFSVPASLKLWIDQICRAGRTFQYTDAGPVGLLKNKRAVILLASGGTPVDSDVDFATPFLRQIMRFIGIHDIEVVAADAVMASGPQKVEQTKIKVAALAA